MKRIREKLNNQKGASITWALLIFLVCAVVGSAVLVAGTTAAGRMSKLAENDQRYYAVTSTAGLLRDILGQETRVTRTEGTNTKAFEKKNPAYANPGDPEFIPLEDIFIQKIINTTMSWTDSSANFENDYITLSSPASISLTFSSSDNTTINSVLGGSKPVSAALTIKPDGTVLAAVSKDGYSVQMSFELARTMDSDVADDGSRTKSDSFKWVLKDVQKQQARATSTPQNPQPGE